MVDVAVFVVAVLRELEFNRFNMGPVIICHCVSVHERLKASYIWTVVYTPVFCEDEGRWEGCMRVTCQGGTARRKAKYRQMEGKKWKGRWLSEAEKILLLFVAQMA